MVDLVKDSKFPIISVTAFEWARPLADGAFADASSNVPAQLVDDIQIVIDELQFIVTGTDLFAGLGRVEIKVVANDNDSAKKLVGALERLRTNGMEIGEQAILKALQSEKEISPEVKAATVQYLERLKQFLSKAEFWSVNGNEIAINGEFAYTVPTIGVLTGLLLPAVQAAREAARRMQSQNNEKQLMLSILNYESTFKRFPSRATKAKDGKPLLSWRVAILPYIEQNALYQQFHLDEPWDSDHNSQLIDRMPATFKHPNYAGPEGHTVYLAPYYEDTVWNQDKPRFASIIDGTSNTIALFEVNDEHAVPWTKPEDLDLHELDLMDCFRGNGSNVAFFDGSVRYFLPSIDPAVLKACVTSAGGEVTEIP
jgi:prepilin-type processing-associated H-X9-DG protein